jgi:hypothetical protein
MKVENDPARVYMGLAEKETGTRYTLVCSKVETFRGTSPAVYIRVGGETRFSDPSTELPDHVKRARDILKGPMREVYERGLADRVEISLFQEGESENARE